MRNHNSALWGSIYSQWLQLELGLAGRFVTKDVGMFNMALTTPGAMDWWEGAGEAIYPEAFHQLTQDPNLTELHIRAQTDID